MESNVLAVVDKLESLENRSRLNNIHIVGLPETSKAADLHKLCVIDITKELGMVRECMVERAQRLGILQAERKGPRQVIVKYLNNGNKAAIMQKFCSKHNLKIEGTILLIFADYSIELSKKRKLFSKVCTQLYHKQIRFSLAYPAVIHVSLPNGGQRLSRIIQKLKVFLIACKQHRGDVTPEQAEPYNSEPRQG